MPTKDPLAFLKASYRDPLPPVSRYGSVFVDDDQDAPANDEQAETQTLDSLNDSELAANQKLWDKFNGRIAANAFVYGHQTR